MALTVPSADRRRAVYMPLKLKRILLDHDLVLADLCRQVLQLNGRPLSKTAGGYITNFGQFPKESPRHSIEEQIRAFLRAGGVPESEILRAFEPDSEARAARTRPLMGRPTHTAPAAEDADIAPAREPHHIEPEMLTPQAKRHFNLFRDPFVDDVQGPDDLFLSADQRYVREAMFQAARQGGWFIGVVGESGSGKTTLRRETIDRIGREKLPVVVILPRIFDKTTLNARHICEAILADLNPATSPRRSLEALARQVERALIESGRCGQTHVLMIEEAHDISIQTLKYLKRFWEMEDGFKKLLSIVLIGQPELKDMLDERRYFEAREVIRRIELVELMPLDNHLMEYLELKFRRIGKTSSEVLDGDAVEAIRLRLTQTGRGPQRNQTVSTNYPLVVNNLVTKALNRAAELGAPKVMADIVRGC